MHSDVESHTFEDGSISLAVLDRLTTCRTETEFIASLQDILHAWCPAAEVAVITDPDCAGTSAAESLASRSWRAGKVIRDGAGVGAVGADGSTVELALAVIPSADGAALAALAHAAARLMPGVRALEHLHPSQLQNRRPVLEQVRELDREARKDGDFLVVALVDQGVDPTLSGLQADEERIRLKHRLRRILRPYDRVWEFGQLLVVAQVLPEPDSGLLVSRLAVAVKEVHAESGVSRRLVDSWVTARGVDGDAIIQRIERARQGLQRMAQLRAAGMAILAGADPHEAFRDLGPPLSAVVVVDAQRMIRAVNPAVMALFPEFGATDLRDAVDTDDLTFHHPDGSVLAEEEVPGISALQTGLSVQDRLLGVRYANNEMHWGLITAVALADASGRILGYVADVVLIDLPGQPAPEERIRDAIDFERSPLVFLNAERDEGGEIVDFQVTRLNSAAVTALRIREEDAIGASESELEPSQERLGLVLDYAGVVTSRQAARQVVAIPEGGLMGAFEVTAEPFGDGVLVVAHSLASGSRRGEMARLWDSLTGLASRQGLLMRMDDLQRQSAHQAVTLIMCDIDDFAGVNDSLGRLRSDRYLVEVGRALAQLAGPHDIVARVGSDEFAFLTAAVTSPQGAVEFAETVRRTLKAGVRVGDRRLTAAASVGVAWSANGSPIADLLGVADLAMYQSKAAGGDCVTLGRDRKSGLGAVELESELRRALELQQFVLHYQPIIDLTDRSVRAVEALIRWQHPSRGLVMPGDFIAAAERRHPMGDIGIWVLETVCAQMNAWREELGFVPKVSINISTGQLARPGLATAIARRAADAGIPPTALQLEITESQLLNVDSSTLSNLAACREVGCALAIDDFGTGHAGFDYLRRIPAQVLKIDKTFIDGLGVDTTDTAIVTGVIAVGHGLGLTLVAEGVEQPEQADVLAHLGCDAGQGWLWSPAVAADDVVPMLRDGL